MKEILVIATVCLVGCFAMLLLDGDAPPPIPAAEPEVRLEWQPFEFEAAGPVDLQLTPEDEWLKLVGGRYELR